MAVTSSSMRVEIWPGAADPEVQRACRQVVGRAGPGAFRCDPRWLTAVCIGLRYDPYLLVAKQDGQSVGFLPLAFVKSWLFGRFLVSLPYRSSAGVVAADDQVAAALVDRAVGLADQLDVRYLELRHERPVEHPALKVRLTSKVCMRLALPSSADELWTSLKPKVRNQVRKGERSRLSVHWGGLDLLDDFYTVFARNMRDLGTPVFGRHFFRSILSEFPQEVELCSVRLGSRPIAAALLLHGDGVSEVPSASSLRRYSATNANMLMYWHLLQRAIGRNQQVFDFGRSTIDSNTFRFKRQWGAQSAPLVWQYYVRKGQASDMRPDNGKYGWLIDVWRRLPVCVTRLIGPAIVRGIPS